MKIVKNLNTVWDNLQEYKNKIDVFCGQAAVDQKKLSEEVQQLRASKNYTEKYISDYSIRNNPVMKYEEPMRNLRAEYTRKVSSALADIKEEMDSFFKGEVSPGFSAKVTAATAAGMRFSDEDFELMCSQATSYMECKIINSLAESRTKEETCYSKKDGEPQKVTVKDPYVLKHSLPILKEAEQIYNAFRGGVEYFLNKYCGTNLELYGTLGESDDIGAMGMVSNADAIFRSNGHFEKVDHLMNLIKDIAPAWAAEVPSISSAEKAILDMKFDPSKASQRTRTDVLELELKDRYLGGLARKDERYMHLFEPEPKYIM